MQWLYLGIRIWTKLEETHSEKSLWVWSVNRQQNNDDHISIQLSYHQLQEKFADGWRVFFIEKAISAAFPQGEKEGRRFDWLVLIPMDLISGAQHEKVRMRSVYKEIFYRNAKKYSHETLWEDFQLSLQIEL